jgi:hypothetical protein
VLAWLPGRRSYLRSNVAVVRVSRSAADRALAARIDAVARPPIRGIGTSGCYRDIGRELVEEARRMRFPLAALAAQVQAESDFASVFAQDGGGDSRRGPNPIRSEPGACRPVTQAAYRQLRAYTRRGYATNGVGLMALTAEPEMAEIDAFQRVNGSWPIWTVRGNLRWGMMLVRRYAGMRDGVAPGRLARTPITRAQLLAGWSLYHSPDYAQDVMRSYDSWAAYLAGRQRRPCAYYQSGCPQ